MFKGDIYIQPRCSGKTVSLLNEFLTSSVSSIYVTVNESEKKRINRISDSISENYKIYSINDMDAIKSCPCKQLFIDEYLLYTLPQMVKIYDYISLHMNHRLERVVIRTTSHVLYKKRLLDLARLCNSGTIDTKYIKHKFLKELSDLMINLLCHPLFEVHSIHDTKASISSSVYRTQFVGEYYD